MRSALSTTVDERRKGTEVAIKVEAMAMRADDRKRGMASKGRGTVEAARKNKDMVVETRVEAMAVEVMTIMRQMLSIMLNHMEATMRRRVGCLGKPCPTSARTSRVSRVKGSMSSRWYRVSIPCNTDDLRVLTVFKAISSSISKAAVASSTILTVWALVRRCRL